MQRRGRGQGPGPACQRRVGKDELSASGVTARPPLALKSSSSRAARAKRDPVRGKESADGVPCYALGRALGPPRRADQAALALSASAALPAAGLASSCLAAALFCSGVASSPLGATTNARAFLVACSWTMFRLTALLIQPSAQPTGGSAVQKWLRLLPIWRWRTSVTSSWASMPCRPARCTMSAMVPQTLPGLKPFSPPLCVPGMNTASRYFQSRCTGSLAPTASVCTRSYLRAGLHSTPDMSSTSSASATLMRGSVANGSGLGSSAGASAALGSAALGSAALGSAGLASPLGASCLASALGASALGASGAGLASALGASAALASGLACSGALAAGAEVAAAGLPAEAGALCWVFMLASPGALPCAPHRPHHAASAVGLPSAEPLEQTLSSQHFGPSARRKV